MGKKRNKKSKRNGARSQKPKPSLISGNNGSSEWGNMKEQWKFRVNGHWVFAAFRGHSREHIDFLVERNASMLGAKEQEHLCSWYKNGGGWEEREGMFT